MRVTLDDLVNITDPLDRAKAAQRFVTAANEQLDRAREVRATAVSALLDDGMSVRSVARTLNLSPSRVQQMRKP